MMPEVSRKQKVRKELKIKSACLNEVWENGVVRTKSPDLCRMSREELLEELRGKIDEKHLSPKASRKALIAIGRKLGIEKSLVGSDAILYRIGIISDMLPRLEHSFPAQHAVEIQFIQKNEWAVVAKAPSHNVKLGSALAKIDTTNTLLTTFDQTTSKLRAITHQNNNNSDQAEKLITFRSAPCFQGWLTLSNLKYRDKSKKKNFFSPRFYLSGSSSKRNCFAILAYSVLTFYDRKDEASRKKIISLPLADATLSPHGPKNALHLIDAHGHSIVVQPPPSTSDKWKPIIPITDLAALLVVAIAHATGSNDMRALETCRAKKSVINRDTFEEAFCHCTPRASSSEHSNMISSNPHFFQPDTNTKCTQRAHVASPMIIDEDIKTVIVQKKSLVSTSAQPARRQSEEDASWPDSKNILPASPLRKKSKETKQNNALENTDQILPMGTSELIPVVMTTSTNEKNEQVDGKEIIHNQASTTLHSTETCMSDEVDVAVISEPESDTSSASLESTLRNLFFNEADKEQASTVNLSLLQIVDHASIDSSQSEKTSFNRISVVEFKEDGKIMNLDNFLEAAAPSEVITTETNHPSGAVFARYDDFVKCDLPKKSTTTLNRISSTSQESTRKSVSLSNILCCEGDDADDHECTAAGECGSSLDCLG